MRCPICDFNEDQPLSSLGLAHGYLADGTKNYMTHHHGVCQACLEAVIDTYAPPSEGSRDYLEVDDIYEEDFITHPFPP